MMVFSSLWQQLVLMLLKATPSCFRSSVDLSILHKEAQPIHFLHCLILNENQGSSIHCSAGSTSLGKNEYMTVSVVTKSM